MLLIEQIINSISEGRPKLTESLIRKALDEGVSPQKILDTGMLPPIKEVGEKYKNDEVYIARILSAARCVRSGLEILKPYLNEADRTLSGKIILGTVSGDLHDVGKNLVGIMFQSAGFEVIDLGVDVSEKKFVQAIKEYPDVTIVCISSLLTVTMPNMKSIVRSLNEMPERAHFKIMVGGAPVTKAFADGIGADAYTENAYDAAELAKLYFK